jgi:hypothetical protein
MDCLTGVYSVEHWTRARVPGAHTGMVFVAGKIAGVGSSNISNSPVCVQFSVFLYFTLFVLTALDTLYVITFYRIDLKMNDLPRIQ